MMESIARQALQQRISDAERALEASLANGATGGDLVERDESLQILDRLLQRYPEKKTPPWVLPLSVAVAGVSLLGIAAGTHLPAPLVVVDARVTALTVTAAASGTGVSSNAEISVKSLEVAGDTKAQAIAARAVSISTLKLAPGTTALIEQHASCFEVQIPAWQGAAKKEVIPGLDLIVIHPPKISGQLPTPAELHVPPGATVTICGDLPAYYSLSGNVGRVDLYRRQPGDALRGYVELRTPSIVSGKLRLPHVSRTSDLQDTEMISLDGVTRGWAFIFPRPAIRLVFSGKVDRPVSVSPTPDGESTRLEPSLLEWVAKSPLTTAVFGLVTGIVGILWGLARYFGLSAR